MKNNINTTMVMALVSMALHLASVIETYAADLPTPVETSASATLAKPTQGQVAYQSMGFGLFVHWSPCVYQGTEIDRLTTPKERINPDRFDAGQIVRAARSCGAGYVIFVAKHCGGYCAWQTKTTDYSLKTSPWQNGKGDMVGELAAACGRSGLKFGVYLCPRDDMHGIPDRGKTTTPEKQLEANDLYRRQLAELLTQYGPLFEVWFDGGNAVPVNDLFDRYAPDAVTFQGRRHGSSRWVGTEHGHAPYPCWNTVKWNDGDTPADGAGTPGGNLWAPAECDVSILRPNWFWSPGCDERMLSNESLTEIYYLSIGRGANLLLNITPDDHGAIPEAQMKRLAEFGDDVRSRFGVPLAATSGALKETSGNLVLGLDGSKTVDHIRLREDIRGGERARKFTVLGRGSDGDWRSLVSGSQIGNGQIIPFPSIAVTDLKLEIIESVAPVSVSEFAAFHVARQVPALAYREGCRMAMRAPKVERHPDGTFSLDCPSPSWETRYTLDGSEPDEASPIYHEPQRCPQGGLLKARYFDREGRGAAPGPVVVRHMGLPALGIKVLSASSQDVDGPATAAFDANVRTMWYTAWRPKPTGFPHDIVLDLGGDQQVTGIACLPRQDVVANQPAGIRIFVSADAAIFPDQPQGEGTFGDYKSKPQDWHEMSMPAPATGRYVKLVFTSAADNRPHLVVAEMEILVK